MNNITVGEWLAIIGILVSTGTVIYKLGVLAADNRNLKNRVEEQLGQINCKMDTFVVFVDDSLKARNAWSEWRGVVTNRLDDHERRLDIFDRRSGEKDRRHDDS